MVDKDQAEINAIRKVFNESDVLLCWYHVTQVSSNLRQNGIDFCSFDKNGILIYYCHIDMS